MKVKLLLLCIMPLFSNAQVLNALDLITLNKVAKSELLSVYCLYTFAGYSNTGEFIRIDKKDSIGKDLTHYSHRIFEGNSQTIVFSTVSTVDHSSYSVQYFIQGDQLFNEFKNSLLKYRMKIYSESIPKGTNTPLTVWVFDSSSIDLMEIMILVYKEKWGYRIYITP